MMTIMMVMVVGYSLVCMANTALFSHSAKPCSASANVYVTSFV